MPIHKTAKAFLILLLAACALSSCQSYKNVPYYKDLDKNGVVTEKITNSTDYVIRTGDILGINITSRNPESVAVFNYNLARVNGNAYNTSPDNPVIGYRVDENGNIHLPLAGDIKASGSTTQQLTESLGKTLLTYLKDPVVNIRVVNFKVYVYGDVARPNAYTISDEHPTVTQALTIAGDLNITGLRKKVLLIRTEDGERKYIPLDLTSRTIFQSPYFYLKNNDEIYVTPGRAKLTANGLPVLGIVISALSVVAILLTRN
ncbi:polysaccharide export protein [Mucilaginibacter rubeus]|uniref:Polysaccharide biosynthesis/export family protein n=1 Tax=Mucilaginibacter rubeus TaxID=2027860 RepID=A0AAE6JBR4_9SPHI|nr:MULTISPECIES: polysaccharide biosynthesis/export family protein [Mucilaginibacter]QEM02521.1 polysaccharide export protein [Mucilaginibacter rubeus]QEM15141.1 polysaccharide export protein [Mucilaginibacter gossypii]QTE42136.1 polysaccharide biosynthesis/export family protein [Mucilaginibacter rubeus]QTE48737.1 polysaccharide biosynthesis/export family protein [Mucilaginibacter rubeus]QTE53835.1 polysaccharide biosynthesis/export family protein [Mucilaginibacter rubeus]